ncbi:(5-formylfuran-3-yl)methyl phosphate synthase [Caulifigura coniformis]|uniref:(5-formylfuran-3-yl)methyl phosphate synthase n=1 Tax=Caulifigura coniformis TaxID=2527983 RepID=UPI001E6152E7|nr:(5-formylfuran-3-yl)methyl phosphate synthase [Caulifigura coniformis]
MSVRSALEAASAIEGGAEILDVKDPDRGSLGCPAPDTLFSICQAAGASPRRDLPVTVALGECLEWTEQTPFPLPGQITMAKIGLSGLGESAGWRDQWLRVRQRFEDERGTGIHWVAVAYLDQDDAGSPSIDDIAGAAIDTGCAGLLLDTFNKSSGRLFDHVSPERLAGLAGRMHSGGRFLAAAGRLNLEDITRLSTLPVDVVAVRSAACEKADRRSPVTSRHVAECLTSLRAGGRQAASAHEKSPA